MKDRIEELLDELIGQLNALVERAFRKHGFNRERLRFDDQLGRKAEANGRGLPTSETSFGGQSVPPCPVCGVVPHSLAIHDEWCRLSKAKSEDKVAADREAYPAHECVDQPTLPCPACLKWTGDGYSAVRNNPQYFPGIVIPEP